MCHKPYEMFLSEFDPFGPIASGKSLMKLFYPMATFPQWIYGHTEQHCTLAASSGNTSLNVLMLEDQ